MTDKKYSVVTGDINGRLSDCFAKLNAQHAKQNFAFAIIAGNLFANPKTATEAETEDVAKLLRGEIEISLPTYFTVGRRSFPIAILEKLNTDDGELCSNLTALGRKVSLKTAEGIRLVAVGGANVASGDDTIETDEYRPFYSEKDTETLSKNVTEADILISSEWPAEIRDGSKVIYAGETPSNSQSIAALSTALKPKYHFSTSSSAYEREPFFHNGEKPRSITRFISLAPFGNPTKQKWIYAFSLDPSAPPPFEVPTGYTASPFSAPRKRKLDPQVDSFNDFRYANGNSAVSYERNNYSRNKRQRQGPPAQGECYFCLSNPKCETHMIVSISEDTYVATSKGPLSTKYTFPGLDFPCHVLLVPVQHLPTFAAFKDAEERQKVVVELQRYRTALHNMLIGKCKGVGESCKYGSVTWEISRANGVHLQWQFMPIQVEHVQKGLVKAAFEVEAENLSYPKFAKKAKDIEEAEDADHFKVQIWSEGVREEMALPLDASFRFDLQFGRRVLAKLLGVEPRTHWKDCGQSREEEEADAEAFKGAFKEFDFSLQ